MEYEFKSHEDPTKARIHGTATVLDKDVTSRVRDFIAVVFAVLPKLLNLYIEGDSGTRNVISDWFFSLDIDALQQSMPIAEATEVVNQTTFRKLGAFGRRLSCNACSTTYEHVRSRQILVDLEAHKEVTCPACGAHVVGVV